jgi:hypothetical protein
LVHQIVAQRAKQRKKDINGQYTRPLEIDMTGEHV